MIVFDENVIGSFKSLYPHEWASKPVVITAIRGTLGVVFEAQRKHHPVFVRLVSEKQVNLTEASNVIYELSIQHLIVKHVQGYLALYVCKYQYHV